MLSHYTRCDRNILSYLRVWDRRAESVDTTVLSYDSTKLFVGEIENLFTDRLEKYARFLIGLDLKPPFHWIGGLTGVKDRRLEIPLSPGTMRIAGWPGPQCLSDTVNEEGSYDSKRTPTNALNRLFKAIYEKSGVARPDHLPQ